MTSLPKTTPFAAMLAAVARVSFLVSKRRLIRWQQRQALKALSQHIEHLVNTRDTSTASEDEVFRRTLLKEERWVTEEAGDGNCLFRAISRQVFGTPLYHFAVRLQAVDHVERHRARFEAFYVPVDHGNKTFLEYIKAASIEGFWGGALEIRAIEELYDRNIIVHTPDGVLRSEPVVNTSSIELAYHNGNHYNSIRYQKVSYPLPPRGSEEIFTLREFMFFECF